jgi:hypothetical protein
LFLRIKNFNAEKRKCFVPILEPILKLGFRRIFVPFVLLLSTIFTWFVKVAQYGWLCKLLILIDEQFKKMKIVVSHCFVAAYYCRRTHPTWETRPTREIRLIRSDLNLIWSDFFLKVKLIWSDPNPTWPEIKWPSIQSKSIKD